MILGWHAFGYFRKRLSRRKICRRADQPPISAKVFIRRYLSRVRPNLLSKVLYLLGLDDLLIEDKTKRAWGFPCLFSYYNKFRANSFQGSCACKPFEFR